MRIKKRFYQIFGTIFTWYKTDINSKDLINYYFNVKTDTETTKIHSIFTRMCLSSPNIYLSTHTVVVTFGLVFCE